MQLLVVQPVYCSKAILHRDCGIEGLAKDLEVIAERGGLVFYNLLKQLKTTRVVN